MDGIALTGFTGRWLVDGGMVVTAIAVRPPGVPASTRSGDERRPMT